MKRNKEVKDKTRNNIFAAAIDELKRNHGLASQIELARKMGVSKDTITNIVKGYTEVKDDTLTKLQTACGCIFNLQWLRGESRIMLAADLEGENGKGDTTDKDRRIAELEHEVEDKKEVIAAQKVTIASLQQQAADLRLMLHQNVAKEVLDKFPFSSAAADGEPHGQTVSTAK